MALRVKWNKRAIKRFDEILKYIESEFGSRTAKAFVRRSFTIIETLQEYPELGSQEVADKKIRGFLITKHNRVFYRYNDKELVILNFFDTRQHPTKKKF